MENKRIKKFQKIANLFHKFGTQTHNIGWFKLGSWSVFLLLTLLGVAIANPIFASIFGALTTISAVDALSETIFHHGAKFCDIAELEALRVVSKEAENELVKLNNLGDSKTSIEEQEVDMLKAAQEYCKVKNAHVLEETTTDNLEKAYNKYKEEDNLLQKLTKNKLNQEKTNTISTEDEDELVAPNKEIFEANRNCID